MLRVLHLQRRPIPAFHHSIEGYFASIRGELRADIDVRVRVSRFNSTGLWRRAFDVIAARARRADVFHVTGDIHFLTYLLPKRRTILTVLDCGLGQARGFTGFAFRLLWLRIPARRAATLVAISAPTARDFSAMARVPVDSIHIVPVTVDEGYIPVPREVNDGPAVLLCVGITPNKNLERVVAAVAGLPVELRIIGAVTEAQRRLLSSTAVQWTSEAGLNRARMRAAYADADIVVFPSTFEGFGMPIVEAQAVGRPVVTSARAPMDWVAGDAACLVDPEDVASIRAGIERVLGDDDYRRDLVSRGFENRERFRPAVAAVAYAELYRQVAATRRV